MELRLRADLAAALLQRDELQYRWAVATHSASGTDSPESIDVELARVEATIAELQERLAELAVAPEAMPPPATAPALVDAAEAATAPARHLDDWLTTAEAAAVLRVTVKGLERMRAEGRGPPFKRIGRAVRYRRGDLTGK